MKKALFILLCSCAAACTNNDVTRVLTSPNGKIKIEKDDCRLEVSYKSGEDWEEVMTLPLEAVSSGKPSKTISVEYDMIEGKRLHCTNQYKQMHYTLADGTGLDIRAYNDGIAWKGPHDCTVDFSEAENSWLMRWTDSYEDFFQKNRPVMPELRLAYPALFEYEDGFFALLSESDMHADNAASSFYFTGEEGVFDIRPDGEELPGWQTLIIGTLGDVVESTLITDNSEPCKLEDTSWIEPGVASWVYWAYNHGSNDMNIIKRYVDLSVALGLPYVLIDAEWDEMKDGYTIEDAIKYAVDNDVKPIIWYSSSIGWLDGAPGPKFRLNEPEDREKEFAWCESLGVKGVKIDFFSGDTQRNMDYMIALMECAARHHLLVNFHGATTMRGWQRTYPNLVTTEAVYGAEWYNNLPFLTDRAAAHNATLPFTRNVLGSMDYTPCAFTDSQHPHITTHAHELALTALFESGIQHLADRPESFLSQPDEVKEYLGSLPTAWDETRYISGYPGESAVLARHSGSKWYIAGINGKDEPAILDISAISSLNIRPSSILLFADGESAEQPWNITRPAKLADLGTDIECRPRGGFIIMTE